MGRYFFRFFTENNTTERHSKVFLIILTPSLASALLMNNKNPSKILQLPLLSRGVRVKYCVGLLCHYCQSIMGNNNLLTLCIIASTVSFPVLFLRLSISFTLLSRHGVHTYPHIITAWVHNKKVRRTLWNTVS